VNPAARSHAPEIVMLENLGFDAFRACLVSAPLRGVRERQGTFRTFEVV
jgi:hypothetical protein